MDKKFKLKASEIKRIIPNMGYCYATDMITVEGKKVGYMYRETPDRDDDSGWKFFSGDESEDYADDPNNYGIYDVNTIANYDSEIIPFLNSPYNTAFGRDSKTNKFIEEDFSPPEE
jgi:hypothetical protein